MTAPRKQEFKYFCEFFSLAHLMKPKGMSSCSVGDYASEKKPQTFSSECFIVMQLLLMPSENGMTVRGNPVLSINIPTTGEASENLQNLLVLRIKTTIKNLGFCCFLGFFIGLLIIRFFKKLFYLFRYTWGKIQIRSFLFLISYKTLSALETICSIDQGQINRSI